MDKNLIKILEGAKTVAVVCNQWGDTGKGKFVDLLGEWADIVARGTGGANAGHTIVVGDTQHIFHLIPSGILHDARGTRNIIGSGVAFDPVTFCNELAILKKENLSYNHLRIALNAKLVLPQHCALDRALEVQSGTGKIGTTGRGIGPTYADHVSRTGLIVNDLLNERVFVKKITRNLEQKVRRLKAMDSAVVKEVLHQEDLGGGRFFDAAEIFDIPAITQTYLAYGEKLRAMITDMDALVRKEHGKKKILLEGAQGLLLSVDYGSYPFVTSSDPSVEGLAKGVGLRAGDVDRTFGITKAFYMTRVGAGPFPTELGGTKSDQWCAIHTKKDEEKEFVGATVNERDDFTKGVGIRFVAQEYGATTGRPRRTGWLDLPLLRHALMINGPDIVLTMVDVLDECDEVKICTRYTYEGADYVLGERTLTKGDVIDAAVVDSVVLEQCTPLYETFTGWHTQISIVKYFTDLPENLLAIVAFIEKQTGANVCGVSLGPDRKQVVWRA